MYNDRSGPTSLVLRFRLDIWLQELLPPSPISCLFLVYPLASSFAPDVRRLTIIAHLVMKQLSVVFLRCFIAAVLLARWITPSSSSLRYRFSSNCDVFI